MGIRIGKMEDGGEKKHRQAMANGKSDNREREIGDSSGKMW